MIMKHTLKDAEFLVFFLRKTVSESVELIGSFGKGATESDHDIDVYIPGIKRKWRTGQWLATLLEAKSHGPTDWGGIFFKDTFFGNVDVFFSKEGFDK